MKPIFEKENNMDVKIYIHNVHQKSKNTKIVYPLYCQRFHELHCEEQNLNHYKVEALHMPDCLL